MMVRPVALAMVVNGLLAAGIALSWVRADMAWTPPPPLPPDPTTISAADWLVVAPADAAALQTVLERPLFSATRRPAEALPTPADNAQVETRGPAELLAVGLIGTEGGGVLLVRREGRIRRVAVGDDIDGWTLAEIVDRRARLVRGDEVRELVLQRMGNAKPGGPPSSVGGAAAPSASAASQQSASQAALEARIAERRARREAVLERIRAQ